jgi:hypothetical protein
VYKEFPLLIISLSDISWAVALAFYSCIKMLCRLGPGGSHL